MQRIGFSTAVIGFGFALAGFFMLPMLAGVLFVGEGGRPMMHVRGGDLVVVRESPGTLAVLRQRGQSYSLERIRRFHGAPAVVSDRRDSCYEGCGVVTDRSYVVAYLTDRARLTSACRSADVVVMPYAEAQYPCRALLLDSNNLRPNAPVEVIERDGRLLLRTARRARLWQP